MVATRLPMYGEPSLSTVTEKQREFAFTDADFDSLRALARQLAGISLADSKRELVYGRVSRRLRELGMTSFAEYRALLAGMEGDTEIGEFINAVTTNLTAFFREKHHFDYLRDHFLVPRGADAHAERRIRIWCAAASTGEEPYSIAMTIAEAIPDWQRWDIRVLATDLDTNVLRHAEAGIYKEDRVRDLPRGLLGKYFVRGGEGSAATFKIKPELAQMISFRQLNLIEPLPMRGPLDAIFCRNVIIYFDKDTQRDLFSRMAPLQRPSDLLFLGHSETLFKVSESWKLVGKTVYRRDGAA
jgi:chemotaxis protein methyltransferase CheR